MNQQEIMEIVTTDTITVLTHEEKVHHASQHPESLKQVPSRNQFYWKNCFRNLFFFNKPSR